MTVVHHSYDKCPDCGRPKRTVAAKCRACRFKVGKTKRCTACGRRRRIKAFGIRTRATPKPRSICLECAAAASRKYHQRIPKHLRNVKKRRWEREHPRLFLLQKQRAAIRRLGLEREMDVILLALRIVKRCAICGRRRRRGRAFHIDHDHRRKQFRGLICEACNLGLGHFHDNPKRLRKAAKYLLRDHRSLRRGT
jgi:hypothetical protein